VSPPHHGDPRPFLSLIAWPEGHDRSEVVTLLAETTGLDARTLHVQVGHAPPRIVGQFDPDVAGRAIEAIREAGGDAFAPTLGDLAAFGETLKIRDLRLEDGVLVVDLWRGPTATIRREQVEILIRAHLTQTDTPEAGHLAASARRARLGSAGLGLGLGLGLHGATGIAIPLGGGYLANVGAGREPRLTTSDKLDVHTRDGRVYQIDGDKFGYRVLGELRGHSDRENMDRMTELLAHVAPDEIVDPYFSLWSPPIGYKRLQIPRQHINRDDPAFAFYSRWSALMYRHLIRG
jgi:hypothetical protein